MLAGATLERPPETKKEGLECFILAGGRPGEGLSTYTSENWQILQDILKFLALYSSLKSHIFFLVPLKEVQTYCPQLNDNTESGTDYGRQKDRKMSWGH